MGDHASGDYTPQPMAGEKGVAPGAGGGDKRNVTSDDSPGDIDQRIWLVVAMIPAGFVATYGDIAARAGLPGNARRVGRALRALPAGTSIPWHRVINAQGRLSLPPNSAAGKTQRCRLLAEGVAFSGQWRIDLRSFRWSP